MKRSLLFPLLALVVTTWAQENFDTVKIVPVRVAGNIYMLKGSGGNIGVLTGKDGVLMVDDQFAPLSNKIKDAIKSLDPGDIRFLINTHLHGDHSGGNENFKKMGIPIIAHNAVRERMGKERFDKTDNKMIPAREKDAWPIITFADKISFHLNDEDIDLLHFTNGHTDGDVVIHFRNANVFHMGDMFVRYGYPYIDLTSGGGINGFIAFLDKVLPIMDANSKVIPGHGEVATKADVKIFRDRLADMRDQVAAALKKGKKPGDIPAMGITDKYDADWGHGFLKGKDYVLGLAESILSEPSK